MPGGVNDIWAVVVPQAGTNYIANPSFERDTSGWLINSSQTGINRQVGGVIGAACVSCLAVAVNNWMMSPNPILTTSSVSDWTVSCWVLATQPVRLYLQNATTTVGLASADHPADGQWHRLAATATAVPIGTQLRVYTQNLASSAWQYYYVDGVQLEPTSAATTYIDGDQDGCVWTGAPHLSISTRDGQDTRGGAIKTFESIGVWVSQQSGIGVPPMAVSTQPLAISDGASFQRSTAKERVVTLAARIFGSGTAASLHEARRTVTAAFASAFGTRRGPTILRYAGSGATKQLAAYYEDGLGWDSIDGADEHLALRFRAADPVWQAETESAAPLTAVASTGSASMVLRRNADGTWDTMDGGLQTPPGHGVFAMAVGLDGTVYVGGNNFTRVDGGVGTRLLQWDPVSGTWSRVGSLGDPNSEIDAMAVHPGTGDLYISGSFTQIGASSFTRIARYSRALGTWNALGTGLNNFASSLAFDNAGNLYAAGPFTSAGGVGTNFTALWNGSAWSNNSTAAPSGITGLTLGPDGLMYANVLSQVYYKTSLWTNLGLPIGPGTVSSIRWYKGWLYVTGDGVDGGVARYRDGAWEVLGDLLTGGTPFGTAHLADGTLVAYGSFSNAGGIPSPSGLAMWDGAQWFPMLSVLPYASGLNAVNNLLAHPDGAVTLTWQGSAASIPVPGIVTVTNNGSAPAYPVIEITGVGSIYSLENLTTKQVIKFSAPFIYAGMVLVIDLRPGRKTVRSQTADFLPTVLTTSDLAAWCLAPGTNRVALYCDFAGSASIRWRQRDWGAD